MSLSVTTLKIENLYKEYVPGKLVLSNINIFVQGSGLIAIIGPSGTGKSTLIRCINRLVEPTRGIINFCGENLVTLNSSSLRKARRQIGMVFQEFNLVERLTVMENILSGRLGYISALKAWLRIYPPTDIEQAYQLLDLIGLRGFENQRADSLSGGQRQRVGIARSIMQSPRLLLADEPTSSLDPKTSVEIMKLMQELGNKLNIPVIVNMHDVELAKRFATRIIGMSEGKIIYDGSPEQLNDSVLRSIYGGKDWLQ
ncbi:phosphonate ABC transporter ATP-binding protein [Polynucleobacter sp. IMCC30063]|uniref:phosphonate ABC transporter ATP-binding protein n=1 Tax=unclassified Polynucleobacter TaxID=2640945 RepID=UPI001F39F74F|nr:MULTISPECIES: phosphonate ABC transporter ATP-binding protein [unclassified Polynucleobacter]MCE7505473.1 phosphonate ABC transporter ATP-binding protein [Polynucleobacter sp. IMCC30063]MCE7528054.1 phosphonate ABC transporter ATP-binding protein [Polynucleobacter sp. IMCC 30228]MCE7530365.1 phosphonate ABC transporter ATP-binding protein [Polynucleobacter sp. IMCC 29146]